MNAATEQILIKVDEALREYNDELVESERRRAAQMAERRVESASPIVNSLTSHFPPDDAPPPEPVSEPVRPASWLDGMRARWGWL